MASARTGGPTLSPLSSLESLGEHARLRVGKVRSESLKGGVGIAIGAEGLVHQDRCVGATAAYGSVVFCSPDLVAMQHALRYQTVEHRCYCRIGVLWQRFRDIAHRHVIAR